MDSIGALIDYAAGSYEQRPAIPSSITDEHNAAYRPISVDDYHMVTDRLALQDSKKLWGVLTVEDRNEEQTTLVLLVPPLPSYHIQNR